MPRGDGTQGGPNGPHFNTRLIRVGLLVGALFVLAPAPLAAAAGEPTPPREPLTDRCAPPAICRVVVDRSAYDEYRTVIDVPATTVLRRELVRAASAQHHAVLIQPAHAERYQVWVSSGSWRTEWVDTSSWRWVSSGYWQSQWVASGYWTEAWIDTSSWRWVSSGYWSSVRISSGYWTWRSSCFSGWFGRLCWSYPAYVDTSSWTSRYIDTSSFRWVASGYWTRRYVDTSRLVERYIDTSHRALVQSGYWRERWVDTSHWETRSRWVDDRYTEITEVVPAVYREWTEVIPARTHVERIRHPALTHREPLDPAALRTESRQSAEARALAVGAGSATLSGIPALTIPLVSAGDGGSLGSGDAGPAGLLNNQSAPGSSSPNEALGGLGLLLGLSALAGAGRYVSRRQTYDERNRPPIPRPTPTAAPGPAPVPAPRAPEGHSTVIVNTPALARVAYSVTKATIQSSVAMRGRVSEAARQWRSHPDPVVRAPASQFVRRFGAPTRYAAGLLKAAAKVLPVFGGLVDVGVQLAEGHDLRHAVVHGVASALGGSVGAALGALAGIGLAAGSFGAGFVLVPTLTVAGGFAGGHFGGAVGDGLNTLLDVVFGGPPKEEPARREEPAPLTREALAYAAAGYPGGAAPEDASRAIDRELYGSGTIPEFFAPSIESARVFATYAATGHGSGDAPEDVSRAIDTELYGRPAAAPEEPADGSRAPAYEFLVA